MTTILPYRIAKEFHFDASHRLTGLEEGHKCARMHGHSYRVRVVLEGKLNDSDFVRDYGDLTFVKEWIDSTLDHRHLRGLDGSIDEFEVQLTNDRSQPIQSSAENLARMIYNYVKHEVPELTEVGVSETQKTWAWYRRGY